MQAGKLLAVVLLCMRSSTVLYHLLEQKGGEVYHYKSDSGICYMHYINTQHLAHDSIGSVLDLVQELMAYLRTCRKRAKTPKKGEGGEKGQTS